MALTRGDKTIILGAVALAVTVVLGLAILKKPFLFSGGAKGPVAAIPPAPTAASVPAVEETLSPPPAPAVPVEVQAAAPATAPPAVPTPATPAPAAAVPAAAATAQKPAGTGPAPSVAGDETLEKMFAEIAGDPAPVGKAAEAKAAPGHGPAGDAGHGPEPAPVAEPKAAPAAAPQPAPAPAPVVAEAPATAAPAATPLTKAEQKAQAREQAKEKAREKAKAAAEAKAAAPAAAGPKPAAPAVSPAKAQAVSAKAGAAGGNVIRIVAEEKPGEYLLVVHTSKPAGPATKLFMTDPPRLVLDLAGPWTYTGPMSTVTGNDFIRQIRVGKHPDMFRVVLDMAPDATSRLRGAPAIERVPEGVALRIPK
ncbi:hypothetical protein DFW101_2516 [Solidesulfovibrio carbinoliphilus subsp. oakridgensis]|uniref:AMIN domain-containing protein n=1 Tax=Solidesulfovibrio carbinoliphilus subsp. oakridgensis TaxID=694327 RepID=G7Q737_9BACT|nr:AMIN domain-containing protein [Solidesulfovibrio carbinoliphilus]EHJ48520.1 hypothetical protein DFW101_2516 [Solidesulfovibrio carbinoliphilus subsp. oakridgensis]